MNTRGRLLLAAALLAVIQILVDWGGTMGIPTQTLVPSGDLRDLPLDLGSWTGQALAADSRLLQGDSAGVSLYRRYTNPAGDAVLLYSAIFTDLEVQVPPHPPGACYTATGHRIADSRDLQISAASGDHFLARLLTLERQDVITPVLFWYQVPGTTYVDGPQQRRLFWSYRGQKTKPAVIKLLVQTTAMTPDQAVGAIESFAPLVYSWVRDFQSTGQDRP